MWAGPRGTADEQHDSRQRRSATSRSPWAVEPCQPAVLLSGAENVTITHNTITGAKDRHRDVRIRWDSTGNIISFNNVTRTDPDVPDPTGHRDRCLHPRRLERHADLQHLQQLEHEHCGGGTDFLHAAAQRQRVPRPTRPPLRLSTAARTTSRPSRSTSSMPRRSPGRLIRGRSRRGCRCRREGRSPEPPPQRGLSTSP